MSKILGIDSAYADAVRHRGRNMLISANLVAEMIERINQLEASHEELKAMCVSDKDCDK